MQTGFTLCKSPTPSEAEIQYRYMYIIDFHLNQRMFDGKAGATMSQAISSL